MKKKYRIKDLFPPGADYRTIIIAMTGILLVLFSFGYGVIQNRYEEYVRFHDYSIKTAPDIMYFLDGTLWVYPVCLECALFLVIYNYYSFRWKSKSIYLMKRLPDQKELHVRCLAGPVIFAALATIIVITLLLWFRSAYLNLPKTLPGLNLPEYRGIDFWRTIL